MPKKVEVKIGGDHLAALVRPVLGGLASMAVVTGYPSKSVFIAQTVKRIMQVAKRGNASELTADDKKVLAFLMARALKETGNEAVAVAAGDTLVLVVDPPKGRVTSPQALLTLTGGLQAAVVADEDKAQAVLPGDLAGSATVDLPWDRTPATYEGLPATIELRVPSDAEYIAVFNAA